MPKSGKNNNIIVNKNQIFLALILILSFFFRFYHLPSRFVFNQDQARDTIMSIYALKNQQPLLLGSAASAGPFNFGPIYHWLIAFSKIIIPGFMAPWLFFSFISSLAPLLFYQIGKNIKNQTFALILAGISCLASLAVKNSPDMLNTILVFYLTSLSFLFLSIYLKRPSSLNLFFLSFFISLATTPHFQALGLFSISLIIAIQNIKKPKRILLMIFASLLAYLPNIIFDLDHNFAWSKSVFNYYTSGQSIYYYPVRWLTDVFVFWPQLWGKTITLNNFLGYPLVILFILAFILNLKKIKKNKMVNILILSFLFQIVLIRYYKGPRSEEYFFTFIAFFIFLTAWSLYQIVGQKKLLGSVLTIFLISFVLYQNYQLINQKNSQAPIILDIKKDIETKTGQNKFSYYTLSGSHMLNMPLFYLLYDNHQISPGAYKIGTCKIEADNSCPDSQFILSHRQNYIVYDLNQQNLEAYQSLTPQIIYNWLYVNY